MSAIRQPSTPDEPNSADIALERRIRVAEQALAENRTTINWQRLRALIGQRSQAQIARMERQKGLR